MFCCAIWIKYVWPIATLIDDDLKLSSEKYVKSYSTYQETL